MLLVLESRKISNWLLILSEFACFFHVASVRVYKRVRNCIKRQSRYRVVVRYTCKRIKNMELPSTIIENDQMIKKQSKTEENSREMVEKQ